MKKIDEVAEILKTDCQSDLLPYGNILNKYVLRNAIIGFVLSFVLSVVLIFFSENISPLVKIEVGLFKEIIIGYCVLSLIITVALIVFIKKKPSFWLFSSEKKSLKWYYHISTIFDFVNFIASSLLVIYFILLFIVTPTTVIGISMEDTYHEGDRILVWQLGYQPKRNDVVVIDASKYRLDEEAFFIKRVCAVPNDKIKITENGITVNDVEFDFSGKFDLIETVLYQLEVVDGYYIIPEKKYLVLGDNRRGSSDSRYFGLIDYEQFLGRAVFRVWPINKFGLTLE